MDDLKPYLDAVGHRLVSARDSLRTAGITVEVAADQASPDAHIGSEIRLLAYDVTGDLIGAEEQWIRQGEHSLTVEEFLAPLAAFIEGLLRDNPRVE